MSTLKIHKGDTVVMLNGPDRGKSGKVTRVLPRENTVVVEGLNLVKRHLRARQQNQKGQVISRESQVNASRVALVCASCGKPGRIGFRVEGDSKVRICRKCKAQL